MLKSKLSCVLTFPSFQPKKLQEEIVGRVRRTKKNISVIATVSSTLHVYALKLN